MPLEVSRRRIGAGDDAVEIVDISGRLDMPGAALLRNTVQDILKEGCARIAINMTKCVEIHREMMGTFHSLGRACIRAGGALLLFGATGDVKEYVQRFGDSTLISWHPDERTALRALHVEVEKEKDREPGEPEVVVVLGNDPIFRKLFWERSTLGGRPVAKHSAIESCLDYLRKKRVHMLIMDAALPAHDLARLIREIRTTPAMAGMGIFVVGPPTRANSGKALKDEGADDFVPYVFRGEEILSKLDPGAFFARLKDSYDRFTERAQRKADQR